MNRWLYNRVVYHGKHTEIKFFGGWLHASMSTNLNPYTWFIYFGKKLRITANKTKFGFAFIPYKGHIYYHLFWLHGQIGWHFPWRKYAIGSTLQSQNS
jgi:hypothetical protein